MSARNPTMRRSRKRRRKRPKRSKRPRRKRRLRKRRKRKRLRKRQGKRRRRRNSSRRHLRIQAARKRIPLRRRPLRRRSLRRGINLTAPMRRTSPTPPAALPAARPLSTTPCSLSAVGTVWGGSNLSTGVDCSGFVMCVYAHFGYSLPHSSAALANCGKGVSYSNAQMGDVICYQGHCGLYIGGGKMVNALGVKYGIVVSKVNTGRLVAVRRII